MFLTYELIGLSKAPLVLGLPGVTLIEAAELEFRLRLICSFKLNAVWGRFIG